MNNIITCIRWILKWLFYMSLAFVVIIVSLLVSHVQFNFCPLHFDRFTQNQIIPIIYGIPTEKTWQELQRKEVTLGGCFPMPQVAICPYCWMPARYRPWAEPPAIQLDEKAMNGLSSPESRTVRLYATQIIAHTQIDADDRITALLVTPTDVWIGTHGSGLHCFDRRTQAWKSYAKSSYEKNSIGYCIKSIRNDGTRIYVEHETMGNGLFYEDYTNDRGTTWKRP